MDEKRPKRRKDKYNPYTISKSGGKYFLSFEDGQGVTHNYEIDRPLFELFDSFELEDLSHLNEWDRHIEQSDLTEATLNNRAYQKPPSIEDAIIHALAINTAARLLSLLLQARRNANILCPRIDVFKQCTDFPVFHIFCWSRYKRLINRG